MELYAAVVNTYSCIGDEFHNFCAAVHGDNRGKGRGKSLRRLLSLLAVYANAEIVLLLHAPSKTRAQREDVMVATAAKDAAVPAAPPARGTRAQQPPKAAQPKIGVRKESACNAGCTGRAGSADSKSKPNPKAKKRPDLRGAISFADGENRKIVCLLVVACKDWKP